MKPTTRMRAFITGATTTVLPAVGDPFAARLAAAEGYRGVMVSGNATSAMRLGLPDVGLLTMSENADTVRRIFDATGLPVFADADTGYGNAISVRRTVRELERAGAAAIMIEDQVTPKRCGMLAGKAVVPPGEMCDKIRSAVDARVDADLVVVARTDARAIEGLDAAIERARAYAEAGADAIFVEGPRDVEEARALIRAIDRPQLYNVTPSGSVPPLTVEALSRLGFKLMSFSVYLVLMAMPPMRAMLRRLAETGDVARAVEGAAPLSEYLELLDLDGWSTLPPAEAVAEAGR
ncbi:isocitrate lyase/PEP mutase family protein [Salinarimonas sp. NSM]|uniref:isocitrate lyase/PEP mutase family protein n=1 Tax=Salinarimonas sp. NSM TaxID=3458003 RepID=UPI0040353533